MPELKANEGRRVKGGFRHEKCVLTRIVGLD
jgi:hypothetical protein